MAGTLMTRDDVTLTLLTSLTFLSRLSFDVLTSKWL